MVQYKEFEEHKINECEDDNRSLTIKEMEALGIPTEPIMVISFNQKKY